jgi:hypothetical protein
MQAVRHGAFETELRSQPCGIPLARRFIVWIVERLDDVAIHDRPDGVPLPGLKVFSVALALRAFCPLGVSPDLALIGKRSLTGFGGLHPDNGNPPRVGAYRPRLDRSQPIARKPVQQRVRETMGQVRHGPAVRRIGK